MFTFSVVVVDLPTDCILSFLFPAETDVLVPVFSQSTDVVVVNFVVVLKFPIVTLTQRDSIVAQAVSHKNEIEVRSYPLSSGKCLYKYQSIIVYV